MTPPAWMLDPAERARRNAGLLKHGPETGFWDEHGNPAPWPDVSHQPDPEPDQPF